MRGVFKDIQIRSMTAAIMAFLMLVPLCHGEGNAQGTRLVTDRIGRAVKVPVEAKRIACFFGPSYEKVFLLGSADKVAVMSIRQPPWAQKLNPNLKKIPLMPSYSDPDVERILELGIDLVFYWQFPQQIEKMSAAGIPVVCLLSGSKLPTRLEAYIKEYKEEIRLYGEVLGDKARKIADAYCAYYDKRISKVLSITSKIPFNQRPRVYYISGRNVFGTQGRYSLGHWLVEMAGDLRRKGFNPVHGGCLHGADHCMESRGHCCGGSHITRCHRDRSEMAGDQGREGKKIYTAPEGVFIWGHGSSEVFLFVMYLCEDPAS